MTLYSDPPALHSTAEDKPTLLVCWWITIFCTTIILLRIAGRFIRSERLFVEDKFVALAIIPLFFRMGCVHVILKYGTNNADFTGITLSAQQLHQRSVASGLVLASRIFHAATLWVLKLTILEFFRRINDALSDRFSQVSLVIIRIALAATFIAVIISDLVECHPFSHYWRVLPDPGGQCRQGYAQLITLSVCNIFTDLLLVVFPIPIILFSHQTLKRRIQLALLFSMSLGVVGVTIYRVVRVVDAHGSQQLRSLLASVELLFATAAANALVLGSFVRDRGTKKNKFRGGSVVDSMDRSSIARSRRPTMNRHWGSDEDLVRGLGLGVRPNLRNAPEVAPEDDAIFSRSAGRPPYPVPAVRVGDGHLPAAAADAHRNGDAAAEDMGFWSFPDAHNKIGVTRTQSAHSGQSEDDTLLKEPLGLSPSPHSGAAPRKVSFYDVGGLLSGDTDGNDGAQSNLTLSRSISPGQKMPPSPAVTAGSHGFRRGSTLVLQDLGGLLGPRTQPKSASRPEADVSAPGRPPPSISRTSPTPAAPHSSLNNIVLMDAGGLLGRGSKR